MPDEDQVLQALASLVSIIERRRELEREELDRFRRARDAGATWQQIAESCGYRDRRGAHMRFQALLERAEDQTHSRALDGRRKLTSRGRNRANGTDAMTGEIQHEIERGDCTCGLWMRNPACTSARRIWSSPPRGGAESDPDSEQAWHEWFSVQHDLCRDTENAIARESDSRGDVFAAALCSALIEHVAEMQRRYLHLPGKTAGT